MPLQSQPRGLSIGFPFQTHNNNNFMSLKLPLGSSVGFVCVAITTCYLIHQKRESTNSPPPSEKKKNITSETTLSTTQFPWEPRSITKSQSKLSSSSHNTKEEKTVSTGKHHQEEDSHQQHLQFLSSMTFANSTLRPSCPCCI